MADKREIRPAISSDIQALTLLDHGYSTDHVWQMNEERRDSAIAVTFRQVRLPRPMRVGYPRSPVLLIDEWTHRSALFVVESSSEVLAYLALSDGPAPSSAWVTDLAVGLRVRREGIASSLLSYARQWARQQGCSRLFIEMQSKNYPAIRLVQKLGFRFSGYADHFYPNKDIAIFFVLEVGS